MLHAFLAAAIKDYENEELRDVKEDNQKLNLLHVCGEYWNKQTNSE